MIYIVAALCGYLFGCINPACVIAKIKKVDIRNIGSNNPGASNVFITMGAGYGVLVGALDILKSFLSAEIIFLIFEGNLNAAILAGAMAVCGHCFPFWLKFNGGKGFAPFMGLVLFYDWKMFLIYAAIVAAITLITDYISIATFSLSALTPLYVLIFNDNKIGAAIFLFVGIVIWIRHRRNMVNLFRGTEIGFRRKNKYVKKEP